VKVKADGRDLIYWKFAMSLLWLRVAVLLYGVASLAVLPAALYERPRWRHIALPAAVMGVVFQFVALSETMNAAHHRVPVEAREVQALMAMLIAGAFLLVYWRYRTLQLGVFALPIAFTLALVAAFVPGQHFAESALVRSGWIWLHVALLLAAYAAMMVSLLASVLYLVQERRLKTKGLGSLAGWLPPLETMDQIALKSLLFGLPCMTGGLLIGSVVAQETVGPAYFADPKVLLSFGMWVAYILMIHIRRISGLRGRRAVYLSSFVFLVMIAAWAANQFSNVHRFTS
jgi:ABC-type uncharacterized transport system permease subunit